MATGYTSGDPNKVDKAGDTLTGELLLDDGSPAASEQYVDDHAGGGTVTSVDNQTGDVDLSGSYDQLGAADTARGAAEAFAAAAIATAINALNLGSASTHDAGDFDAAGKADAAQAYAIQRSHHTGSQLAATISDFAATAAAVAPVQSVAGRSGAVTIAHGDVSGLGGAALLAVGTGAGTVAAGDDTRLSDNRTPTDNSVTSAKIADGAIVDADINAAAAIALTKLATNPLARSNHTGTQLSSTISDFSTAAAAAAPVQTVAGRTGTVAIAHGDVSGLGGAALLNVGTGTGTVAAGDDARLSDTRTPTDGSVTSAKILDGAIVDADINAAAAIALTKLATNPLARSNHTGTQLASTISDFATAVGLLAPPTARQVATAGLLSGGGALSGDLTLNTLGLGPQPTDLAFLDWSFDPQLATSSGTAPSSGLVQVTKLRARSAMTISTIYLMVGATGTQPSNVVVGIYDATGNLITNATGTVVPATWNTTGVHAATLTTPVALAAGAWYYVAWFVNGATSASVIRANASGLTFTNNAGLTGTAAGTPATAFRAASANSGQTTTMPSSLGTLTAVAQTWWVAVA